MVNELLEVLLTRVHGPVTSRDVIRAPVPVQFTVTEVPPWFSTMLTVPTQVTLTGKVQALVWPAGLVAWQFTMVVPIWNEVPDAGKQTTGTFVSHVVRAET